MLMAYTNNNFLKTTLGGGFNPPSNVFLLKDLYFFYI